ncbi:MAG: DUF1028 domain-containing protein [candidate division Zixibacteria bacterium]|nr:DUF1028 domain-containing protein [candidate division Zixibacteria bacterium]
MRLSTFSIVAFDEETGDFGVAVQSKFLAVGAVVPHAAAGIGAIATQALANVFFGPAGLDLLAADTGAIDTLEHLLAEDEGRDLRQVGIVDTDGTAAAFTGERCMEWAGHLTGPGYACLGNLLTGDAVVEAMEEAFEQTEAALADRLLAALAAGQRAGGDRRGQQSAALVVVRENAGYGGMSDRLVDLRVDDHPTPIEEMQRLYGLHQLYFGVTDPSRLLKIEGTLALEVQRMLHTLGYYSGALTGIYDEATRAALEHWHGVENFEERLWKDAFIDPEVLAFMREKHDTTQ